MDWKGRRASDNFEDRRASGGGRGLKTGGLSIGGIILALVLWKFFGVDPSTTLAVSQQMSSGAVAQGQQSGLLTEAQKESQLFLRTVLADTEDTWSDIFQKQLGRNYTPPNLVLYSGRDRSGCGTAQSAMGPFYCPADQKLYIDTTFFNEMRQSMGISGEQNSSTQLSQQDQQVGDFAQAYVVAHEVGHHVQQLLGISDQVQQAQARVSRAQANNLSVRLELQADCLAGVWANQTHQRTQFLKEGDVAEAMDAARKIGDDYLQKQAQGYVVPDSFTHGTSAQREHWFNEGLRSGNIQHCDTFSAQQI